MVNNFNNQDSDQDVANNIINAIEKNRPITLNAMSIKKFQNVLKLIEDYIKNKEIENKKI